MKQDFQDSTAAEIEAKLQRDLLDQQEKIEKFIIISIIVLIIIFRGTISYWLKFGRAIPFPKHNEIINTQKEYTIQTYDSDEQIKKQFTYKSLISPKIKTEIKPLGHLDISGTVIGFKYNPIFFFSNNEKIQIFDLGLAFGEISDAETLQIFRISLYDNGAYSWNSKSAIPFENEYVTSHLINLQIIPANNNIMAALLNLKEYNKVKLTGEIVTMDGQRPIKVYVDSVQIGTKIYK